MKQSEARKHYQRKAAAFERLFNTPDGKFVLEKLEEQFGGTTLKKTPDGLIDPNASIAAAGCREVLLYIQMMRKAHAVTAGDS